MPEQKPSLESALRPIDGKKFEYRKKVVDREYGGALRQIVHYAFVREIGFVYFRFNYKQTGSGWVRAHFNYTSETNELFPPGLNIDWPILVSGVHRRLPTFKKHAIVCRRIARAAAAGDQIDGRREIGDELRIARFEGGQDIHRCRRRLVEQAEQ